ncbi:hypothetical protein N7517_004731 [Penicillium concentricum]|uniref:Uncharacterized protein n=1 Tax=Penicillium concentricum TaxID=293559 RepID=A0A9W9S6E0_9EURO|nr:uncharacterized protein N7517_004731 [Penicillium concentricum]KAJ5372725.1 hypothetical protein N7517_004731 [Penicillium concentricum]
MIIAMSAALINMYTDESCNQFHTIPQILQILEQRMRGLLYETVGLRAQEDVDIWSAQWVFNSIC